MLDRFRFITSSVWKFLKPFIAIFLTKLGPVLAESAARAVRRVQVETPSAPGDSKRTSARNLLINDLKSQGIELGAQLTETAINAVIEAAVLEMKAEKA